jgi:hypothetical protein
MGNSKNAFGIFSHSREIIQTTFGQGSQYTEGLLLFWKGRYFISILCSPETDAGKKAVLDLAGLIDKEIIETGPMPSIVSLLPESDLREESIRYFRHYIWLNSHFFIADQNIFRITDQTEAVLAKYGKKGSDCVMLMILYSDPSEAENATQSFLLNYKITPENGQIIHTEDGIWTGWQKNEQLLTVIFNAREEEICKVLLNESAIKYQKYRKAD